MALKKLDKSMTFLRFAPVNGRGYKTIRAKPSVGPTPSINLYDAHARPAESSQANVSAVESEAENNFDFYSDRVLDDSVDADALESWEASVMRGYVTQ